MTDAEETKKRKAQQLRYRKPIVKNLNLDKINEDLWGIQEECESVRWYTDSEDGNDSLINALDGDEDEAYGNCTIEARTRELAKLAGVEKANPHKFRRTCATLALRRGMPIEQVSKMLGHEEISTTQIYLDLSEKDLEYAHGKYVV